MWGTMWVYLRGGEGKRNSKEPYASTILGSIPETDRTPYYELLNEFNLHFNLRDLMWSILQDWWKNARPRQAYPWIDWLKVIMR
jgi:hypothetical protein